jgi:hypothetical protein
MLDEMEAQFGPFVGLLPRERRIWARFLASGQGLGLAPFTYNVRVGRGLELGPGFTEEERQIAWLETAKRIDIVSKHLERPTLIEVKHRAGLSSVGQLLGYEVLYRSHFDWRDRIDLLLVTDVLQTDMHDLLAKQRITAVEVGLP